MTAHETMATYSEKLKVDHGGPDFKVLPHEKQNWWYEEAATQCNKEVWDKFKPGTRVIVRCPAQDGYLFFNETGVVEATTYQYLGIRVRFTPPRRFSDGFVQTHFCFNPSDLELGTRHPVLERVW